MSKLYTIKMGILFVIAILLFLGMYVSYENGWYLGLKMGSFIWLLLTLAVLIFNHIYFSETGRLILNILNWLLSLLMLTLFGIMILESKNRGFDFNGIPTFAFLSTMIAIVQDIVKGNLKR